MDNPFDSQNMAEGYAHWRPPLHQPIIEKIHTFLGLEYLCSTALDVGCGTGLSTGVLKSVSKRQIGIEPSFSMLQKNKSILKNAHFVAGRAEELPIASNSVDLITAAGSLNWVNLNRFFNESRRILISGSYLVVYDFGPGHEFPESHLLSEWFDLFTRRYPSPDCQEINLQVIRQKARGFKVAHHEDFAIGLIFSPEFYLEYILTETNVSAAIKRGLDSLEIRSWCKQTLDSVFDGIEKEVLFRGFISYLKCV